MKGWKTTRCTAAERQVHLSVLYLNHCAFMKVSVTLKNFINDVLTPAHLKKSKTKKQFSVFLLVLLRFCQDDFLLHLQPNFTSSLTLFPSWLNLTACSDNDASVCSNTHTHTHTHTHRCMHTNMFSLEH